MRSFSMQPSRENITSSLKSNLLDRNKDVFRFASMLTYVDGPMSIARWALGKRKDVFRKTGTGCAGNA